SVFTLRSGVLREGLDFGGVDPTDAALWVEEFAYGAGTDWIGDIETRRELKRAYDRFRTALGEPIPSYPELERLIHDAATPGAASTPPMRRSGSRSWPTAPAPIGSGTSRRAASSSAPTTGSAPRSASRSPPTRSSSASSTTPRRPRRCSTTRCAASTGGRTSSQ